MCGSSLARARSHVSEPAVVAGVSADGMRLRVLAIPRDRLREASRSAVRARKPKSFSAREASSERRGCPFGIDVSQTISPSKPVIVGDRLGEISDRGLDTGAEVDRLGAVVALRGQAESFDAVVDVEELAGRRAVAPEHDLVLSTRASSGSAPAITCELSRSKLSRGP